MPSSSRAQLILTHDEMTLTKAELAQTLADEIGLNGREAKDFVDLFFEEIRAQLEQREPVGLSGFGNCELLDALAAGLTDIKVRKSLGRIVKQRFQSSEDPVVGGFYLSALFVIDPDSATNGLMAKMDALGSPEEKAAWSQKVMPDLFGDGFWSNRGCRLMARYVNGRSLNRDRRCPEFLPI